MAKKQEEFRVEIKVVPIKTLVHNGSNPRQIKQKRGEDLKKSLTDFPEMKEIREIVVDENYLILAGDKRTYMLEDMGYTDVKIKQVFGLTEKKKREFIIKDNDHNGEWDPDIIANEWDPEELADWGVPKFTMPGGEDEKKPKDDNKKSRDVTCPSCGHVFDPSEEE